mmetsp:Transcript_10290/g.20992  ORF Transcript_10290/g.20992 Transcript_10290/m.20992 type:complete len:205 (+) Transcript_10290:1198-1812(+)
MWNTRNWTQRHLYVGSTCSRKAERSASKRTSAGSRDESTRSGALLGDAPSTTERAALSGGDLPLAEGERAASLPQSALRLGLQSSAGLLRCETGGDVGPSLPGDAGCSPGDAGCEVASPSNGDPVAASAPPTAPRGPVAVSVICSQTIASIESSFSALRRIFASSSAVVSVSQSKMVSSASSSSSALSCWATCASSPASRSTRR